jgi:GNAT superfamily N-acetyltransferase
MRLASLAPVIAASWPPVSATPIGPFTVPMGAGGGNRVSAIRLTDPAATDAEEAAIDAALAVQAAGGQAPLVMVLDHQSGLEAKLAARGFGQRDATRVLIARCADIAAVPPPVTCFTPWPPLAIQEEIWAAGGIGPDRITIMERAADPKTSLFGRIEDKPAGSAFIAAVDDVAILHALEVLPEFRRKGLGATMVRTAAEWARTQGATRIAVLVTQANTGAQALYASLGFEPVGLYHYRSGDS